MPEQMREIKDTFFPGKSSRESELSFYACGMQNYAKGMNYGPIVRNYYVIHFVTKGKGTLFIRNQVLEVKKGQAFLLPAHIPHEYRSDPDDPWQYCWLSFLGTRAAAWFQMLQNACHGSFITPELHAQWYEKKIGEMIERYTSDLSGHLRCTALTLEILGELFEELAVTEEPANVDDKMMEIRYFIEMNIGKPLRVKEIAAEFGYHPNYLTRAFTAQFGITPKQYILRAKMLQAKRLLKGSRDSISLIALSLGFPDESSFSRAYRRFFGFPPSEIR